MLDVIILFFIVLSGYRGFFSGFLEQIGQTLGLVISILVSFTYSIKLSEYYIEKVPFEIGTFYFLTFSFIFSLTLILTRIIFKTIQIILIYLTYRQSTQRLWKFSSMSSAMQISTCSTTRWQRWRCRIAQLDRRSSRRISQVTWLASSAKARGHFRATIHHLQPSRTRR